MNPHGGEDRALWWLVGMLLQPSALDSTDRLIEVTPYIGHNGEISVPLLRGCSHHVC